MTYALTALLALQMGFIYLLIRQLDRRDRAHREERGEALVRSEQDRQTLMDRHYREQQVLLNRIQMPEVAVGQTATDDEPPTRGWVGYDDDEDLQEELKALDGGS